MDLFKKKFAYRFYFLLPKCLTGQLDTVVYIAGQWYKKSELYGYDYYKH